MTPLGCGSEKTIVELLPSDVRASTANGSGTDILDYVGKLAFLLSAEAQGSGISTLIKIQESANNSTWNDVVCAQDYYPLTKRQSIVYEMGPNDTCFGFTILTHPGGTVTYDFNTQTSGVILAMANNTYNLTAREINAGSVPGVDAVISNKTTSGFDLTGEANDYTVLVYGQVPCYFTTVGNVASKQQIFLNSDRLKRYIRARLEVSGGSATGATCVLMVGEKFSLT